jgi:DNA-binding LacI/PurR family transcriptional regulator
MDIYSKLHVSPRLDATLVVQIKEQLTWLIASGQIQPGDILPSVRSMASRLSVNLHTVRSAYQKLESQGLVETRQGVGTRVLPYDPQLFMQASSAIRSNMVGIILPDMNNPIYGQFVRGVEHIARPEHTLLLVCDMHDEIEEGLLYFQKLSEKKVDGILAVSFSLSEHLPISGSQPEIASGVMPIVTVDWSEGDGYNVVSDQESGAYQAVRHLVEHGHRRIGRINYSMGQPSVLQTKAGYRRALAEAGIEADPALSVDVHGFLVPAGAEGARKLLSLDQPPSAIFAASDLMAVGALRAIKARGLHVPRDIALVGIDDIPNMDLIDPPLTTVSLPAFEMGRQAMQMLSCLISGKQPAHSNVRLPTALVVRQSCGCNGGTLSFQ